MRPKAHWPDQCHTSIRNSAVFAMLELRRLASHVPNWTWCWTAAIAACLLLTPASVGQINPLAEVLKQYSNDHNFESKYNHLIWNIVRDSLRPTQFKGRLTINPATPQTGLINIFVLARDPGRYFQMIQCNCAFVGQLQAIVCDHSLLDYFAGLLHWNGTDSSYSGSQAAKYVDSFSSEFLLHWIIAHEIGHALHDPRIGAGYFYSGQQPGSGGKIAPNEEIAADEFAAESIQTPIQQQMGWLTIGDVIKTLYLDGLENQSRASRTEVPDPQELDDLIFKDEVKLVLPDTGDPHPPWLVRALNFEETLRSKYPDTVFDSTGYYPKMRNSITVSPSKIRSNSLCQAHLQPKYETVSVQTQGPVLSDYNWHAFRTGNLLRIAAYQAGINAATEWIASLPGSGKHDPQDLASPYGAKGYALAAVQRYSEAVPYYKRALTYTPNDVELHDNLAFGYFELHQVSAAMSEWKVAIKLNPDLADALAGLGIAYFSIGQKEPGIASLRRALTLDPLYSSPDYLRYEALWSERQIAVEQNMMRMLSAR